MLDRREFLQKTQRAILAVGAAATAPRLAVADERNNVLDIGTAPQLFLDDFIIESMDGLKRVIQSPERLPKPVLDNKTFGTTQPFITVLRDAETNRYRIWYNNQAAVWHAESDDGIHWRNPKSVLQTTHCFGASLVDDGPSAPDPQRRYKLANWRATRIREDKPGDDGGMWVAFSPDGYRWTTYEKNPVLPTWPAGYGNIVPHAAQDIVDVFYDPLQRRYAVALKTPAIPADGFGQGPRAGSSIRRLVGMSTSTDFVRWKKPWRIFLPNEKEEGLVEFYGMGGMHQRGGLYIGFVRVLHDDYPCDPEGPKNGIGYTALATSRDGITWNRFREPFLDRNPEAGSWDHAMTWTGYTLTVKDELYLYYGGYARGHKIEPGRERQIGLARMKRDRYVALSSNEREGRLLTRAFRLPPGRLTVNASAPKGEIHVQLIEENGHHVDQQQTTNSEVLRGDLIAAEVKWQKRIQSLRGKPVRLQFTVHNGSIFGFEFSATA
jgi:hypothetical protein